MTALSTMRHTWLTDIWCPQSSDRDGPDADSEGPESKESRISLKTCKRKRIEDDHVIDDHVIDDGHGNRKTALNQRRRSPMKEEQHALAHDQDGSSRGSKKRAWTQQRLRQIISKVASAACPLSCART